MMETDGKTKVCGILANPVEHSMSPALQNLYAERSGVNLNYVPFKVKEEDLEAAVKGAFALNILGMSVTVPHKQNVMKYLREIDRTAEDIGAVNTLVRMEDGYKGYNTDVPGLLRSVQEAGFAIRDRACILIGAGGAGKAAAYMMMTGGASRIYILNRSVNKAGELASCLNAMSGKELAVPLALADWNEIPDGKYFAVQSTSVGMHPKVDQVPIEDPAFYELISEAADVIYTPSETQFMKRVKAAGGKVINGLSMLLYQGVIGFELWNPGVKVSAETVEEARRFLNQLLDRTQADRAQDGKSGEKKTSRGEHLILTGFMGAGKTCVGLTYAAKHEIPVLDTDKLIEMTSRMSISGLFENFGEEEFRRKETQMLKNLLNADLETKKRTVISVGGGLPLLPENRALLKELGTVVYLKVSPETVMKRLKGDTTRPLLQGDNVLEKVEELMKSREPCYLEAAHMVVEADEKTLEEIVEEIEKLENGMQD